MGIRPYEAGARAGGGLTGMMILKPNSKMKLWRASYGKGTTLIRPWCDTFTDDGGNIKMKPHRDNEGHFGTSFIIQEPICEGWGKDTRLTFMTRVEDEDNWPAGSPADVFYAEISNHPDFKYLTERPSARDFAPLSQPSVNGFLKGLLLECGGKDYKSNPVWGCILRLSKSARDAFEQLLDQENPNPGQNTDPEDPNGWFQKYIVGDPTGFEHGKIFEFDKESKVSSTSNVSSTGEVEINLDARGSDGTKGAGGGDAIEKYGCRMWPSRPKLALPPQRVHNCDETYEEAIRFLTGIEQITQVIIPGFGRSCRDAVLYVFGGKDLLPASFEFGRTTHDMGANQQSGTVQQQPTQPAQQPTQPAQQPTQPTQQQAQQPIQPPQQSEPAINLDGPDSPEENADGTEPPFDVTQGAPVEVAPQVNTVAPDQPTAPPVSDAANALRQRLDAANQG